MISRLTNVRRLVVRPAVSVLRCGGGDDSSAARRELGVDFVLDGTIRSVGQRVRTAGQLLDVAANSTRRVEKFNEDLTDALRAKFCYGAK